MEMYVLPLPKRVTESGAGMFEGPVQVRIWDVTLLEPDRAPGVPPSPPTVSTCEHLPFQASEDTDSGVSWEIYFIFLSAEGFIKEKRSLQK